MPKKTVLFALIGLIILALVGGGVWFWKSRAEKTTTTQETKPTKKRIVEPVNVIPVTERPVLYISPQADGRNIDIVITEYKKEAHTVEFELEYTTENLVQGGQGQIDLNSLPAIKKWLLGSCSAGGACSYHTNVIGGSLKTRFVGPENYALKSDWRYIENKQKEDMFSFKDGKFQITAASFAKISLATISNSPGYPKGLEGTPVSDPYVFMTPTTLSGDAEVSIRVTEDAVAVIMAWDGKSWTELKSTVVDKVVTATGPLAQLYIAVKK